MKNKIPDHAIELREKVVAQMLDIIAKHLASAECEPADLQKQRPDMVYAVLEGMARAFVCFIRLIEKDVVRRNEFAEILAETIVDEDFYKEEK